MEQKRGIAVSPGVAIGSAMVLGREDLRIPQRFVRVGSVDAELARFREAFATVCAEISAHEKVASERLGKQYGAIFNAHLQLMQDARLIAEIEELIHKNSFSSEFACSRVLRKYAKTLQNLGDQYLASRAADLFDLEKRFLRSLAGERREELQQLNSPVIILAHNLTPSETANLDPKFVLGFATEAGAKGSHTAILAGALEIPAVVGVGDFLGDLSGGDMIILDGNAGLMIVNPDEDTLTRYRNTAQRAETVANRLKLLSHLPSQMKDGVPIHIYGNIEFPTEVTHCTDRGAEGIGLYRTEFLYLGEDDDPSEEIHYEAYARVLRAFPKLPVVIRTLDLGAEKFPASMQKVIDESPNPCLGLRGVRLALASPPLFKKQLRAVLRAALLGDVRIMFPMVATLREFRQARMMVQDVAEDLEEEKIPFRQDIPIGMMVELPSAVQMADHFAREVDFFSIGTNDLIQYTLGVDRSNPAVSGLYSSGDPALCRMIQTVVQAAEQEGIPVSVCGQMSSDPMYTPLLIGLGVRELSVTPHLLPEIKQVVLSLTLEQAREIAGHVQTLDMARDVESYLRGELKKIAPDLVV